MLKETVFGIYVSISVWMGVLLELLILILAQTHE